MTIRKPEGWVDTTLGEVIEIYDYKRIPLNSRERAKRQGQYPYYGASGIVDYIDDYIFDGRYLLVAEDGENLNSRKTPVAFFANGKFWVNNHAHIIRGIQGISDDYFLMSYIENSDIGGYITGAAQPKLSQANLKSIRIVLPPFPIQRKIADVLSAYDDLIEVNTRRIRILEQMAQSVYREWFGAETLRATSVRSSLPEGWKIKTLGDVADVNSTSITRENEPEEINYVDIASVSTGKIDVIQPMKFSDAPGRARRIVQNGDVIWSTVRPNRKSYSLIINPPENMIVSTGFAVLRAKTVPFSYLYLATTTEEFAGYLTNHATGSAYPAVNSSDFENADILLPPKDLLNRFGEFATPMFLMRENLLAKNANLRRTRDLLLPRLVSGEVGVS